ncbi:MAG: hypothetical protein AAF909_10955 [Pseudomonadota bacterium]
MITELPKLAELGVRIHAVRDFDHRTLTGQTIFKDRLNPDNGVRYVHSGRNGPAIVKDGTERPDARTPKDVSDDAHMELSMAIQSATNADELRRSIHAWADDWWDGGVSGLPDGLR